MSRSIFCLLIPDQALFSLRGDSRIAERSSSSSLGCESMYPKHSASSTTSLQGTWCSLGFL